MNYVNIGPKYVECADGSTNNNGVCPAGVAITGPLALFLQFAGVNGKSTEDAAHKRFRNWSRRFFARISGRSVRI
jgi:hypothetical protein